MGHLETAGHLHVHHGEGFEGVELDDFREFFDIERAIIELGAAHHDCSSGQKALMKVGHGKGHAIGGPQQIRIFEIGGLGGDQHHLDGPLA